MASKGSAPLKASSGSIKGSVKVVKGNAREKLSQQEVAELKEVFDLFDEDHGGTIDPAEIQNVLAQLGLDRRNPVVFQMITDLQAKGQPVGFEEFLETICGRVGDVKSKEGMQKLFNLYDTDESGFVDFDKFKHIAKELSESMNDDEILEMMHHVHILNKTESNAAFDFNDFYRIVTKKKY
jgi:Ca2+-binding EF-hand superfamily protein